MKSIITVENLSKQYSLGARQPSYPTFRDALAGAARAPFRFLTRSDSNIEKMWALKDISFDVQPGETIGIIGRNGAGKSTLLKILSRITEPTSGRALIWGRVASLLEVGTGFHPELTGRENIYLNGAILGMSRSETRRQFDEMVAFAEVERFIDTPVKHYSSGMYLRLAFAVAAHLQPEILIVDEVLAVGDAAFQRKCLEKMGNVAGEGRTVLFVSHNVQAIRQLCRRALWLQSGSLNGDGTAAEITDRYFQETPRVESSTDLAHAIQQLPADPAFRLVNVTLTQDGLPFEQVLNGRPLEVTISYEVLKKTSGMRVFFDLCDSDGNLLFRSFHDEDNDGIPTMLPGYYVSKGTIPADLLSPVTYELCIYASVFNVRMCIPEPGVRIALKVTATGKANRAYVGDPIRGKLAPPISWVTLRDHENKLT